MPVVPLSAGSHGPDVRVSDPAGGVINIPRPQFRCLLELPRHLLPQDGIIDTGAPLIIFPEIIWRRFHLGTDYEFLPFVGPTVPPGRVAGWQFTFEFARFLVPLAVTDAGLTVRVERPTVIAAFAAGDPPAPQGRRALPPVIIGLWGGILDRGKVTVAPTPTSGVAGELHYP